MKTTGFKGGYDPAAKSIFSATLTDDKTQHKTTLTSWPLITEKEEMTAG